MVNRRGTVQPGSVSGGGMVFKADTTVMVLGFVVRGVWA